MVGFVKKQEPKFVPKEESGSQTPEYVPEQLQTEDPGGSLKDKIYGAGEAVTAIGTGMAGQVASGLGGLYTLGSSYLSGEKDALSRTVEEMESISDAWTYEPESKQAKAILSNLLESPRMKSLRQTAQRGGQRTLSLTGSPAAATAVQSGIEAIPAIFGGEARFGVSRGTPESKLTPEDVKVEPAKTGKAKKEDIKRFNKIVKEEGLNLKNKKELIDSIKRFGEKVQEPGFAKSMSRINEAVRRKFETQKQVENRLWKEAREGGDAYIETSQALDYKRNLEQALEGFNLEDMPAPRRMMQRLQKLEELPSNSAVKLSEIQKWRKSLNANMPSDKKSPDARALNIMKSTVDDFLETQFNADMVRGDPGSLARWKTAIDKTKEIKNTFEPDKTTKQFIRQDVSPEQLRSYILNTSSVGAKSHARGVIQNLKNILGDNSSEINALRNETMFNVVEPLIKENPDFNAFKNNYEKFVRKNPALTEELFNKDQMDALRAMYSASKSARKRQNLQERTGKDLLDFPAVALFGHGIAQAGLKVRLAKDITSEMVNAEKTPIKKEIMRDFLGYDPNQSMFGTKKTGAALGVSQESENEQQ